MRPIVHSYCQLLWTDVGLSTTWQEGAATRFSVTVRSREHPLRRAGACGRPNCVHEDGVPGPVQELRVEQDAVDVIEQGAVDVLHCGSTKNGCLKKKMAMSAVLIIVFHPSSVPVTVRAPKKKSGKCNQEFIMVALPEFSGLLPVPSCALPEFLVEKKKTPVGHHYGWHGALCIQVSVFLHYVSKVWSQSIGLCQSLLGNLHLEKWFCCCRCLAFGVSEKSDFSVCQVCEVVCGKSWSFTMTSFVVLMVLIKPNTHCSTNASKIACTK